MKKRAVVYTRVSTDKIEQEKSLEVQGEYYRQYCENKGYELIGDGIYADVGTATSVRRRPEFIKMMMDAGLDYEINYAGTDIFRLSKRDPVFDMIIVKDASRFSRNQEIGISTVKQLRSKGVNVVFENAGVSSFDDNAGLTLPLLFMVAENESEGLSKKVGFTKRYNAKKGVYNPARLPYGYARDVENNIVINEEQAEVVRFIHDNYPEHGGHSLAIMLNEKGILTQQGKNWSNDKIGRIILQPIYYGTAKVGRTRKVNVTDTERIDVPKREWITIPNATPPIISKEQFDFNNKIRRERTNKATKRGRRPAINDIYYEKLFCKQCGSRFVRHIGAKDKITYICQNRRKGNGCTVRGIAINNVNKAFDIIGTSFLMDDMTNHAGYNQLTKRIEEEASKLNERRNAITAEITSLEEENASTLQGIKEQFKDGSQTIINMLTKEIEANEKRIKQLEAKRDNLNINSILQLQKKVDAKKQLIDDIHKRRDITQEKRLKLLDRILVGDYDCEIRFNFPTFEDEILEFNSIFPMDAIHSVNVHKFSETIRRDHKEAREYWSEYDENEANIYERNEGFYIQGKNISEEAKETEKILEESNLNHS